MKLLDRRKLAGLLLMAFTIGLLALWPTTVKAIPPQAITLLYFRGTGQNNAVLIEWATATEFETAGFIIRRADSEAGPYIDLEEIGFIPGEGDGIIGAIYDATDSMNVVNGQTYWYILVEIENGGNENLTDPIAVTGGVPTPTATATQTATATATNPPTSTQPATSIPGATKTATPSPTATTTPTNTPIATQAPSNPQPTATQAASNTNNNNNGSTNGSGSTNNNSPSSPSNTNNSNGSGSVNVVEASSPTDPYPVEGAPSPTFVPDPNQTPDTGDSAVSSPAPGEGTEGYIAPTVASNSRDTGGTPVNELQNSDPNTLSTQPPLDPPAAGNTANQSSSTFFLWIGFTAAFLIFVGGIIGSIFLFTRRSNQK